MRRQHTRRVQCSQAGCQEGATYFYNTLADYREAVKRRDEWKCIRHSSTVLSPTQTKAEWLSDPASPSERYPNAPGQYFGSWGFLSTGSANICAYANDFPKGTRIKVSVEAILP